MNNLFDYLNSFKAEDRFFLAAALFAKANFPDLMESDGEEASEAELELLVVTSVPHETDHFDFPLFDLDNWEAEHAKQQKALDELKAAKGLTFEDYLTQYEIHFGKVQAKRKELIKFFKDLKTVKKPVKNP